jgi:hypothetical protein
MCRSVIGPHALNNWLMLTRRMSTPTVFLPESSEGHGVDGANSSESEGCLAEVKEVEEEAPYGQRYSFSLKRGLCTSVDDAKTRRKPTQASTPVKRSDLQKVTKSFGQASMKSASRRHESRKGDLEPKIIESVEENGNRVTRSRLKNT